MFFALTMLVIMAAAGTFLITDIAHLLNDQDILITDQVVLLRSNASSLWYTSLFFSGNYYNSSLPTNGSIRIFKESCNSVDLHLQTEQLDDETELPTYFNSCISKNGKRMCIFEQFLYLVDTNETKLEYNFTLSPSNYSHTSVNITVFNSHYNLDSYLRGEGEVPIVVMTPLSENFTFTLDHLVNSSYYFFTIDAFNETVESFNYTLRGQRSVYNFSEVKSKPECIITANGSGCLVTEFLEGGDTCFLAELIGPEVTDDILPSDMIFVAYDGDIVGTPIFVTSLILCAVVFISGFIFGLACLGIGTAQRSSWSFRSSKKVAYVKIQE